MLPVGAHLRMRLRIVLGCVNEPYFGVINSPLFLKGGKGGLYKRLISRHIPPFRQADLFTSNQLSLLQNSLWPEITLILLHKTPVAQAFQPVPSRAEACGKMEADILQEAQITLLKSHADSVRPIICRGGFQTRPGSTPIFQELIRKFTP